MTMRSLARRLDSLDVIVYGIGMNKLVANTWTTTVVEVETRRGIRYQGVCYVGEGYPKFGPVPRNADIRYRTRLHTSHIEAREQARSRTIHHNLWHDGSEFGMAYHSSRDCPERRRGPVANEQRTRRAA